MEKLLVEKSVTPELNSEPRYELERTGEDVTEHTGIKYVWLHCPHCKSKTKFHPRYNITIKTTVAEGEWQKDYHYLCQCDFCENAAYVKFWEVDFDPDWHFQFEAQYPVTSEFSSEHLPEPVARSAYETSKCINASAFLAAAVMCRRTVEAVMHDKGAKKKDALAKSIEKLVEDKTLPESMGQLAHLVRLVGNIGAHSSESDVTKEQALEMWDLTQALLDLFYLTPARVKGLKEKLSGEAT